LIALISGAIFSLALAPYYFGGWRFYHQLYYMLYYVNVAHAKLLRWVGPMVLVYGLSARSGSTPLSILMVIPMHF
jgi:hypothetical protein